MVAVSGLGVFLAGPAQPYGVSVFVDPMREEFSWSRSQISIAYSVATLIGALAVIVSGRLLDRVGHRLFLSFAALGFGAALTMMSFVDGLASLTVGYALLRGFGIGALLLDSRTLASQWFVRRRGRVLSLVAIGGSLSLALVPLANTFLIERFNWRDAWRIDAIIVVIVLVPVAAIAVRNRPEDIGQQPDGIAETPRSQDAAAPRWSAEVDWEPRDAIRTRTFWLLLGASMVPGLLSPPSTSTRSRS